MKTGLSSCSEVWAKDTGETLDEHVEWCLKILKSFLEWHSSTIKRISQDFTLSNKELISRLFATVYLHDIGKASSGFQKYIRGGPKATYHPILSIPFALAVSPPIEGTHFEALAILSHHTSFYESLYEDFNNFSTGEKCYVLPCALEFYNALPIRHREYLGYDFPFPLKHPILNQKLAKLKYSAMGDHLNKPPRIRGLFALFVSALHTCDWLGSAKEEDFEFFINSLNSKIQRAMEVEGKFSHWTTFQDKAAEVNGDIFIRIPTGQGKTEAALRWADKEGTNTKIFYLLPTRVVSNHLYERLKKYFSESVGLSHGTSILVLAEEKGWKEEIYRSEHLKSSTGLKPVVVATVDQLLLSAFHFRHWEMLTTHVADAMVIFDEIHSYDLYTTALIIEIAEELRKNRAKLCFMSATFPAYIEKTLREIVGDIPLVTEKSLDELCRHRILWRANEINSAIPEISEQLKKGKCILVVLNTVPEAVAMYKGLLKVGIHENKVTLFHSRFIERDRTSLEGKIIEGASSKGFAAITTQVIEVGIDINYDCLYTQVAPLDALVQRMGRVNRKGASPPAFINVHIFETENAGSDWVYGENNMKVAKHIGKKFQGEPLTELALRNSLDSEQYPTEEFYQKLRKQHENVKGQIKELRRYLWNIQTVRLKRADEWLKRIATTREQQQITVDAIPLQFKDEVERLSNRAKVIEYHVRIPFWMAKGRLQFFDESGIPFVDLVYDPKLGIIDPRNNTP